MIRVGLLGTGFGKQHAQLYQKIDGFEVVSIFGRNKDTLMEIGEEFNIKTTTDINEIMQEPSIDLIDICLPTEIHRKWAIEGLKNGKHIFCETPLAYSTSDAMEIKQVSLECGKNVYVDMFMKFSAPHVKAIALAKDSGLGSLSSIRSYNKTSPRWGDLSLIKNMDTFHIHNIDFVHEIMGMPDSVFASGIDYGEESIVTTTLGYGNAYAIMESYSNLPECCPFAIGFELIFTKGIVQYDAVYGEYTKEEFSVTANNKPREVITIDGRDEYEEIFRHVLYCLQNNTKSNIIDIDSAVNTVKIKEMIAGQLGK